MSFLCGGKQSIWKDMFWLLVYIIKREKGSCPRCGYNAFKHGFPPNDEEYCTKCHLWESDWEKEIN